MRLRFVYDVNRLCCAITVLTLSLLGTTIVVLLQPVWTQIKRYERVPLLPTDSKSNRDCRTVKENRPSDKISPLNHICVVLSIVFFCGVFASLAVIRLVAVFSGRVSNLSADVIQAFMIIVLSVTVLLAVLVLCYTAVKRTLHVYGGNKCGVSENVKYNKISKNRDKAVTVNQTSVYSKCCWRHALKYFQSILPFTFTVLGMVYLVSTAVSQRSCLQIMPECTWLRLRFITSVLDILFVILQLMILLLPTKIFWSCDGCHGCRFCYLRTLLLIMFCCSNFCTWIHLLLEEFWEHMGHYIESSLLPCDQSNITDSNEFCHKLEWQRCWMEWGSFPFVLENCLLSISILWHKLVSAKNITRITHLSAKCTAEKKNELHIEENINGQTDQQTPNSITHGTPTAIDQIDPYVDHTDSIRVYRTIFVHAFCICTYFSFLIFTVIVQTLKFQDENTLFVYELIDINFFIVFELIPLVYILNKCNASTKSEDPTKSVKASLTEIKRGPVVPMSCSVNDSGHSFLTGSDNEIKEIEFHSIAHQTQSENMHISLNTFVYVSCITMAVIYYSINLIAGFNILSRSSIVLVVKCIISLGILFVEAVTIMYLSKVDIPKESAKQMACAILIIASNNLLFWVVNEIVFIDPNIRPIQNAVFGKALWYCIWHIVYPFRTFLRIYTCKVLIQFWIDSEQ